MYRYYEREVREDNVDRMRYRRGDPGPRSPSPDYWVGGGGGGGSLLYSRDYVPISEPYISGAIPRSATPAVQHYEPDLPLTPRDANALQLPATLRNRSHSIPPQDFAVTRSQSRSRSRSSLRKARHAIDKAFTPSSSGVGVGLLGAVVGGLVAREVSDATARSHTRKEMSNGTYQPRSLREPEKMRMISTGVGALVGGLGANALERRLEAAREQDKKQQEAWEQRWGKESDLAHYDTGKDHELDHGRGYLHGRDAKDAENSYQRDDLDNRQTWGG